MGKEIDPSDVGKFPDLIKKAQAEMTKMDVLVCGQCNGIYHFIEQFKQHKGTGCTKVSPIKDNLETKPVIWAFLLWKASQLSQEPNKDNANAWKLYQSWVKLDEAIKETWIVAGRTIQSFAKIGQGQLQEMPVKITKTVVDNSLNSAVKGKPIPLPRANIRPGQKELDTAFNALKQNETKKTIIRSPQQKLPQNIRVPPKQGPISRTALRTLGSANNSQGTEIEENSIEKILAKRFNPRHKEHEYLIKWENMSHESNTWEPASHLETCPVLLDTFEKQLARQKEQRLAVAAKQAAAQIDHIKVEDDAGASKKRKIESPEINKITTISNTAANKGKPNGVPFTNAAKLSETSAEVVITSAKDGKPTGIVKKSGITVNPVTKNEAQVKLIPKGGDSVSGVVRVQPNKAVQQLGNTTVKPVQNVARQSGVTPKPAVPRNIAGRSGSVQQVNTGSPQNVSYQTGAGVAAKPTITRVTKSVPNSKQSTPEQKIAALTRQGDLKITRKPVAQQQQQQQTATVVMADEEDFSIREDFELSIPAAVGSNLDNNSEGELALVPVSDQQTDEGAVLMSDQDGLQQILAATDDGQQQLIQFVTGEDGTIYQVAGKNEQGQTILIAQGADGEQQCVYVAAEEGEGLLTGEDVGNGLMTVDGSLVDGSELQQQQQLVNEAGEQVQFAEASGDSATIPLTVTTEDSDSQDGQITAEVVQADLPSPGGTRRVVLQLPDGTFMVTEVDEEQFKALNMQG